MNDRVPVTFLKAHDKYNGGEIAGFDAAVAKRLIDLGIAAPYDAEAAAAAANAEEAKLTALANREADLAAREAAVTAREAAAMPVKGAPPAQGKAAASEKDTAEA